LFRSGTLFHVDRTLAGTLAFLVETDVTLQLFDDQSALLIDHARPVPGTRYVDSGRPEGPADHAPATKCYRCPETSQGCLRGEVRRVTTF
jgi:hypothetical protein